MATLYFDLDGTLVDVRARHYAVYSDILREMAVRPLPEGVYWGRRRAGEGTSSIVRDLPGELRARFSAAWLERVELPEYLVLNRVYAGVPETLRVLSAGHRLVLLTLRRRRDALEDELSRTGLAEFFGETVSPAARGDPPRKAELLRGASQDNETWVVGDSEADIDLASDLGARCFCVTEGVRSAEFLRARGARLLAPSVRPLPGLLAA
jgi:phosphoglycolate phosphatase-like HAD superfamily hydrolase